jgi:hypothetical protein
MFRRLYAISQIGQPDVVICGGRVVDDQTGVESAFQDVEVWRLLVNESGESLAPHGTPDLFLIDASVCRRFFRRSFLNDIGFRFADGFLFEDIAANYQILLRTRSAVLVDYDGYFYRVGQPRPSHGKKKVIN